MADISTCPPLTRASVMEAHALIRPLVHRTPVLTNQTLSLLASTPRTPAELEGTPWEGRTPAAPTMRLWFKCENLQRVGAFKVRGAFHAVERLKREPGWVEGGGMARGVATHSSGNHAQALALAARTSGMPAHIVMPTISAPPKIAATRGYGANVIFSGSTAPEREAVAAAVTAETGARLVPPYDHPDIILGQGTMGLELQEQVERLMEVYSSPDADVDADGSTAGGGQGKQQQQQQQEQQEPWYAFRAPVTRNADVSPSAQQQQQKKKNKGGLDAIMAPCGGGGMLSGVALSAEGTGISVFGAEPSFQGADDGRRGFASGRRVEEVASLTVADGLRTPVGVYPWSVIYERRLVAGMFAAGEADIVAALRLLLERLKMVVEPSAAVPLAVALYNEDFRATVEREAGTDGWDLGLVLSGGNVSLENLGALFPAQA